jgi:peptidoglycan/xylan/chitin deacetylase (PgdA/CDA1 family)
MAKDIQCAFGVDIDAVAGWLGSYGGEDSPSDIQRGVFAGEVGTPRLLKLFEKFKIKASWFIPGHSIETFPEQTKMIAAAGHEIGAHGYSHENPVSMTRQQEEDVLKKAIELIEKFAGKKPRGYVAPWWELQPPSCCFRTASAMTTVRATTTSSPFTPGWEMNGPRSIIPSRQRSGCGR